MNADPVRSEWSSLGEADQWIAAPPLSDADFVGSFWRFGPRSGPLYTPFLVLAPGGLIGNYLHAHEDMWQVMDGRLAFMSSDGVPTTIFEQASLQDGKIAALSGRVLIPGYDDIVHELRRTGHPAHPLHATPQHVDRSARFLERIARPARPNLVVIRAGADSLHTQWARDKSSGVRNWDLCISYYGADIENMAGQAEYLTHQPAQRKFQALHDLFYDASPLWDYEQIWFPDDDIMTDWRDINRFFHISKKFGFDLAQPALENRPGCFINHEVTAQQEASLLRFVHFVELMCPLFSPRALRICLGTFRDSVSGFGLDHLWPALLGGPRFRVGIVDEIGVVHTRPLGQNYDTAQALIEERAILAAYRLQSFSIPNLIVAA